MASISIEILWKSIANLEQAVEFALKHKKLGEMDYYFQFRTAAIQSFEYSYEIANKLIRRHVESADIDNENRHLDFRDYMRVAAEYGLLNEPEEWVEFREWRNRTSHAYDQDIAEDIFLEFPKIVSSLKYTAQQLAKQGNNVS